MTNLEIEKDLEHLHECLHDVLEHDENLISTLKKVITKFKKFAEDTKNIVTVQTEVIESFNCRIKEIENEIQRIKYPLN